MPHFAHDLIASDPDSLARLREVLHGRQTAGAPVPSVAERFGAADDPGAEIVKAMRKPRRRRRTGTDSLVTS